MPLLEHNQTTLDDVEKFAEAGINCCVVNACGSGKTSIMSEFIKHHPNSLITILTKQGNAKEYYHRKNEIFAEENVRIRTYSKMYLDYKNNKLDDYDSEYLLVDEAHYVGASNWKKAFMAILEKYRPICIGLTATPQRFEDQGTDHTIIKEFFDGYSVGNFTASDLQKKGVFIEPEYVLSIENLLTTVYNQLNKVAEADISEELKLKYIKKLENIKTDWENNSRPDIILKKYLPNYMYKEQCNRILVYVSDTTTLPKKRNNINKIVQSIFPDKTIKSYDYTYKSNEKSIKEYLEEDDTYIKIIYSIDKIMETIHIDDLNIAIMLRPSVSNRIITQQFGRINSINNKNKSLIIDMVDNLNNLKEIDKYVYDYTKEHNSDAQFTVALPHINRYYNVFSKIDTELQKYIYYTYKNVTATIIDLCYIFLRDTDTVRDYINKGYSIKDAIEQTPIRFKIEKSSNITECVLTEEEKEYVIGNLSRIDSISERFNLDEDQKQDLLLNYMYKIHNLLDKNISKHRVTMYSINCIKRLAIKLARSKYIDSIRTCFIDDLDIDNMIEFIQDDIPIPFDTKTFEELLKNHLSELEFNVIYEYYGIKDGRQKTLGEVGNMHGVSGERIRHIIIRAFKKCNISKNKFKQANLI